MRVGFSGHDLHIGSVVKQLTCHERCEPKEHFMNRLSFLFRHYPSGCVQPSQQLLQDLVCSSDLRMLDRVRPLPMTEIVIQPWGIFRWSGLVPAFESLISHQKHSFGITNNHIIMVRSGLLSYCEALKCSTCSLCTFEAHLNKIVIAYFHKTYIRLQTTQTRTVTECNIETMTRDPKMCIFSSLEKDIF